MHPYRIAPPPDDDPAGTPIEEWIVAWALLVLGGVRVAIAIAMGQPFDAEVTIAAILAGVGAILLARGLRARLRGD